MARRTVSPPTPESKTPIMDGTYPTSPPPQEDECRGQRQGTRPGRRAFSRISRSREAPGRAGSFARASAPPRSAPTAASIQRPEIERDLVVALVEADSAPELPRKTRPRRGIAVRLDPVEPARQVIEENRARIAADPTALVDEAVHVLEDHLHVLDPRRTATKAVEGPVRLELCLVVDVAGRERESQRGNQKPTTKESLHDSHLLAPAWTESERQDSSTCPPARIPGPARPFPLRPGGGMRSGARAAEPVQVTPATRSAGASPTASAALRPQPPSPASTGCPFESKGSSR